MKLMAIDSSTKSSGVAVFIDGEIASSCTITATGRMEERLEKMMADLLHALETHDPDEVYIEEAVVLRNAQTQRFLCKLQGAVYAWCSIHSKKVCAIRPTEWRKALGFKQGSKVKRQELKGQALSYVEEKYGDVSNLSEDECEAICIGHAALQIEKDAKEEINGRSCQ